MAITKIQSESLNLSDNYDFTGTVTGAGGVNTPNFYATRTGSDFNLPQNTSTKVIFNTEVFDTDNCYDTSNGRFTPNVSGKYFVRANLYGTFGGAVPNLWFFKIYKNGTRVMEEGYSAYGSNPGFVYVKSVSAIVEMNGTTDYVEIYAQVGVSSAYIGYTNDITNFQAFKIIE